MAEFVTEGATMAEPSALNNLTSLLSAGASHWKSAMNISQLAPSAKDLILAGPRIGIKIGSFLFGMPEMVDNASESAGLAGVAQAGISEAFSGASSANDLTRGVAGVGAGIINDTAGRDYGFASRVSVESARSFGNIFSYSTSRWALLCVTMAIALNRTQVYASTRRSITLGWKIRSALRLIPILLLAFQARSLLQSIQCQTSPDFAMMRWGNASKSSDLMFTQDGGFLYSISSNILFNPPDEASCLAVKMIPIDDDDSDGPLDLVGSLSRLWPMFQTLCLSQFIETISCAVQGRQVASETGMTLFEHSLAFAEAEAAVSSSLGWGPFGEKRPDRESTPSTTDSNMSELVIKRTMIMKRVNTPPEVLLVGFMSAMNHITSHMLGIFNLQGKLRLVSTAFWGICFISTIAYSVINFSIDDLASQALLRFPTVCIVGFIPHILILAGLVLCSAIYGLALLLIALAPPPGSPEQQTFLEKLSSAHNNMQASVSLSNIRINMHMDFYQALLKTGYNALTMASEAVYLNESSEVNIKQRTWLEEQRLQEIEDSGAAWLGPSFRNSQQDHPNDVGLVIIPDESSQLRNSTSGFARERAGRPGGKSKSEKAIRNGIGASERSGRWIMAFEFFVGIVHLVGFWFAALTLKLLSSVGIRTRPRWLTWLSSRPKLGTKDKTGPVERPSENMNFYVLGEDGVPRLPSDENVDVEAEMRRALSTSGNNRLTHVDEKDLEDELYGWWLNGGWWGAEDNSGQFVPPILDADEDNTSMISAIDARERNWESEDEEDGQRTPTRSSPQFSREVTPVFDSPLYLDDLARLLHPKTPEERSEAQALAAHMASDTIMTRSRFNTLSQSARTKMLTSTRSGIHPRQNGTFGKQSPEEEAAILECLINSRREARSAGRPDTSWAEGAAGMGDGGPQCVVCQSAPRSIIVWPCRCLSLCDDCRVSLAMNNFDKCVCCRRDVSSFSRIFVP